MLRLNYDDEEEGNKLNLDVFAKDYEEDTAKCSSKLKSAYSKRIRKLEASGIGCQRKGQGPFPRLLGYGPTRPMGRR